MTFQRVINRNGLADGDYQTPPTGWQKQVNIDSDARARELMTQDEAKITLFPYMAKRIMDYEMKARMLAGDLRRLEADAVDENGICTRVAVRTGVDAEIVAAVLKEFMAW